MKVGDRVRVSTGRNAGEVGTITAISNGVAYVDFGRDIEVRGLFSSGPGDIYPDGYWIDTKKVTKVE